MSMDSLLIVGNQEKKLHGFLAKLGYDLVNAEDGSQLSRILSNTVIDLILIDSRIDLDAISLCEYLRTVDITKEIPIVFLASDLEQVKAVEDRNYQRLECVRVPASIGLITGKIATQLRLRKIAGGESPNASLLEMNAALRDFNQRLKGELEQARAIQLSLLPASLPQQTGFDIAALYQPLEEVGGDWYYAGMVSAQALALQIADVTGHGLSAALIGSMTKLAISATKQHEPALLLEQVNRLMTPQLPDGRFVTMAACLYETASGMVHFANAGHPPALVLRRRLGKVEELSARGFALGFTDDCSYESSQAQMEVNDILVLVTDGITEICDRSQQMYGAGRLGKVLLASSPAAGAQELSAEILADIDEFRQGRILKDDITLMILKRTQ